MYLVLKAHTSGSSQQTQFTQFTQLSQFRGSRMSNRIRAFAFIALGMYKGSLGDEVKVIILLDIKFICLLYNQLIVNSKIYIESIECWHAISE